MHLQHRLARSPIARSWRPALAAAMTVMLLAACNSGSEPEEVAGPATTSCATDGELTMVSDAEVNRLFTDIGVSPNWFIDTPTWGVGWTAQPKQNSDLVTPPTSVRVLLAPRGKFALIDRGQLNIGVTGNVVSRDLDQLARNEFTYFFETFEGIVNTNNCPADILRLPICLSGTQVADDLASCTYYRDSAGAS